MHDNICSRADKELTNTGAMNEVSKPLDPQQVRLLSHDEADSVHEIGLARPIGADHRHKRLEWTNLLVAPIRFEVVHLDGIDVERLCTIQFTTNCSTIIMEHKCQPIVKNLTKPQ